MSNPPGIAPLIMGILNVTPDSFSDGGSFSDDEGAIAHGMTMVRAGADIIDIGGESTRPGADRVKADTQIRRVLPVIKGIRAQLPAGVCISIDTTLSAVAAPAIAAGATLINDVSAGQDDPELFDLAAEMQVKLVLMHMQGTPGTMQNNPVYDDVVEEIYRFLLERAEVAVKAGVSDANIIIDPGIGFGKNLEHNLEIIRNLDRFVASGYPVLLGASRKRFLGTICNTQEFAGLVGATCAVTAHAVSAGVAIMRVHDVSENRQAADVIYRLMQR